MPPATPHFAYGSNMDPEQMCRRCLSARLVGLAKLRAHRFLVTRDGYGSVRADPSGTVYGVIWRLTEPDERALDDYEGVAEGMYAKAFVPVQPEAPGGALIEALIYLAQDQRSGMPQPGYLETVLRAARRHGFPPKYLAELQGWLPRQGA